MSINSVNATLINNYQQAKVDGAKSKAPVDTAPVTPAAEEPAAVFEPSPKVDSGDYKQKISAMLAESQQRIADFQNLFAKYLGGQAKNYGIATWSKANMEKAFANATPEDVAAAQAAISEGGYYSVDSVATRIMDMAMALSGGDPEKIGVLRDAVEKGFAQAGEVFGAALPQICQDTRTEIMARFDEWEASVSGEVAAEA